MLTIYYNRYFLLYVITQDLLIYPRIAKKNEKSRKNLIINFSISYKESKKMKFTLIKS